jgi:adenylate kinase
VSGGRRRRGGRRPAGLRPALPVALTGTPGVGKSAVGRALAGRRRVVEVAELALRLGAGRAARGGVVVDLPSLHRRLRAPEAFAGAEVLVGHLAHLLPVREAIVLRCHPVELARRLGRAHRGTRADRAANFVAEALDLVLGEALRRGAPVYEVDTTRRPVARVAAEVDRRLRRGGAGRHGIVDWLADRAVTEHLLDEAG